LISYKNACGTTRKCTFAESKFIYGLCADVAPSSAGGPLHPSADALRDELFRAGLISGGGSTSTTEAAKQAAVAATRADAGRQQGEVYEEDSEEDLPSPPAAEGGYASASGGQFGRRGVVRPYQAHRAAAQGLSDGGYATMTHQQAADDGLEVPEDIMLPAQVGLTANIGIRRAQNDEATGNSVLLLF
jgi:hypothetical protein